MHMQCVDALTYALPVTFRFVTVVVSGVEFWIGATAHPIASPRCLAIISGEKILP